jgi:hypothetical protein
MSSTTKTLRPIRFRTVFLLVAALLTIHSATARAESAETLEKIIQQALSANLSTTAQLEASIDKAYIGKLHPRNRARGLEYFKRTLENPGLATYLAKAIAPVYKKEMTSMEVTTSFLDAMATAQVKGLARLPTEKQAVFVQHMIDVMQAVPPASCKALLLGKISTYDAVVLERVYVGQLPLEKFDAIASIYVEALEAELANNPAARTITDEQSKEVEKIIETYAVKRWASLSPALIKRVLDDQDNADPVEVCQFYTAFSQSMLDLGEPYRSWQMIKYVQSMQE